LRRYNAAIATRSSNIISIWTFTRTRLAPSPTGALHLGHARTFLITWWLARQAGASVIMRMEDLDAGRAKAESVAQAYDDLCWLGMDWDEGPDTTAERLSSATGLRSSQPRADATPSPESRGQQTIFVQSQRLQFYEHALNELWDARKIYPCTCTRADIAAAVAASASAPQEGDPQMRYPGTCRELETPGTNRQTPNEIARRIESHTGKQVCWRLRVGPGSIAFHDHIAGPQSIDVAADAGDFPLTRFAPADGLIAPAYQLACVVDDHLMAIDAVIRGDDLLASTPRQILLYRALGWTPPEFGHVPLVIGPDGKRLAKRHGESRIAQFRAAGVCAERIIGWTAWRSGQVDRPREISAREMIARFDLGKLPRTPVVLDQKDLDILKP
jgi:glutamyl-tRNA synthetase